MTPENQPGSWVGRRGRGRTGQRVGVWSFGAVRRTDFYALRGEKRAVVGLGVVVAQTGRGLKTPLRGSGAALGLSGGVGRPPVLPRRPGRQGGPFQAGSACGVAAGAKGFSVARCGPEAGYTSSAGSLLRWAKPGSGWPVAPGTGSALPLSL